MFGNKRDALIRNLFEGLLHRAPSDDDLNFWRAEISDKSLAFAPILQRFVESEEHKLARGNAEKARLFVPPGHFYSPIVDTASIKPRWPAMVDRAQELPGIDMRDEAQLEFWSDVENFAGECPFPDQKTKGMRYYYDNPAYSYGDSTILYTMIRRLKPKRLIEIGSGFSSMCALDTIDHFLDGGTSVTFVEPYPQLLEDLMTKADRSRCTIIPSNVQDVDIDLFRTLEADDILFIDSTHVAKTGSDVLWEIFKILPTLKPGVAIHIHDMFYPFEYPKEWVLEQNRSWNELYIVRAFLMHNPNYVIEFFNNYFAHRYKDAVENSASPFRKNGGGALWLRKVA